MKKLFIIVLIISSLGFMVPVADDLDYAICDFIAAGRANIQARTGMYSEAVFWTAHEESGAGTIRRYIERLDRQTTYVYYGLSETSEIQLCVAPMRNKHKMAVKPQKCGKIGKKVILEFTTIDSEDYMFFIRTIKGKGVHLSYLTYLTEDKI